MPIDESRFEYVGFWPRAWASLVDSVLALFLVVPIGLLLFGSDFLFNPEANTSVVGLVLNYVLPAVAIVAFWIARQATPGKMLIRARIVDAASGGIPSRGQLVGRYLGYYVSMFALFIGFFWVGFDPRKQGLHDKLAGTLVVRERVLAGT